MFALSSNCAQNTCCICTVSSAAGESRADRSAPVYGLSNESLIGPRSLQCSVASSLLDAKLLTTRLSPSTQHRLRDVDTNRTTFGCVCGVMTTLGQKPLMMMVGGRPRRSCSTTRSQRQTTLPNSSTTQQNCGQFLGALVPSLSFPVFHDKADDRHNHVTAASL